jgi:omega-amidase
MSSSSSPSGPLRDGLRVALLQFRVTESKEENLRTAASFLDRAAGDGGADLCVLPEIWNSPYAAAAFPEYAEGGLPPPGGGRPLKSPSAELLERKAVQHGLWIVGGSIPEVDDDGRIYNTCLVFDPEGRIVAKHRKVHLFDVDVPGGITFSESDTLSPGQAVTHFDTPWGPVGLGICYDIRFAEYALLLAEKRGCRLLVYPGAFNLTTGPAHWELLQRARAVDCQAFVATASPARAAAPPPETPGRYPHYAAWGHSTCVSPWGVVVATTDEGEGIVYADLDLAEVESVRRSIPILQQKRTDLYRLDEA